MADEYFRETAINGGSILSLVSAQPILRKGGYCVFLFAGTSTLVHYTRKKKKQKKNRRSSRRGIQLRTARYFVCTLSILTLPITHDDIKRTR